MTIIQKINPINKEEEKEKHLFDPLYNPQFEYEEEVTAEEYASYGGISDKYISQVKHILDEVLEEYGSEDNYLDTVEGKVMGVEDVRQAVQEYAQRLEMDQEITFHFSNTFVARTSVFQRELRMRLPIEYREHAFSGTLHHELGTHLLRTINHKQFLPQLKELNIARNYMETEEGLAMIHQLLDLEDKRIWLSALFYYATWYGSEHSFAELNKELAQYVSNPERRWKACLRVKRGLKDTSQPGAFSRNQLYFSGFVEVLQWLTENEYDPTLLYVGKVGLADVPLLAEVPVEQVKLPFFTKDRKKYQQAIKEMVKQNKLG